MKKIAVLGVESINYSIKPEEERKAIIYAFQKFLNSLDFPIQILMNTGTLDLDDYFKISKQKQERSEIFAEIYKEYENFMKETVWANSILNKSFYIVIPETTNIDIQVKICEDRLHSLNLRTSRLNNAELKTLISKSFNCDTFLPKAIKNNIDCIKIIKEFESEEEVKKRVKEEKNK